MRVAHRIAVSAIVATIAFWAYTRTLVPGVDLGDTGGFQAAVLWPEVSARQAYPLYYGLARPLVAAVGAANPARALNLLSAVWGGVAVGLLAFLCASVTRSLAAGAAAGLLLAFSYTFWTQAVIAEVYTLHLALVSASLLALHAYAARPTRGRLLCFYGIYAAAFGNHLAMILLVPACALFLLQTTPEWRGLLRPPLVLAALAMAVIGALQYTPNFMAVWASLSAPPAWGERLAAFWFDTTKQDWRETMIFGVDSARMPERLGMWWFDARQQFGIIGVAAALIGTGYLWRTAPPWAVLALTIYALNTVFALTYNVGDSHVFFLPGHLVTAFCAGAGVAALVRANQQRRRALGMTAALLMIAYAGWRGWTTWPAADRHLDRRGEQRIAEITAGLDDRHALLVAQLNWQLENVLLYTARYTRPDLAWARLGDVMPHWPFLVEDSHRLGRDVVLTPQAAAEILAAYGPSFDLVEDPAPAAASLPDAAAQVPRGLPYVLCILTPPREYPLDRETLDAALGALTGGNVPARAPAAYEVVAGIAGERPQIYRSADRPFTLRFRVLDEPFTVRLDAWLPFDTFLRAGFGHVVRGRDHILIVERGVSLVWLGPNGRPSPPFYAASDFAQQPRYRVPAATLQLANLGGTAHRERRF
ncbi:MAG: hypothetical protein A3G77_02305 [Acidobacteria bacterium RIFCSPLOWO2_12_FULL_68_19]|nr:MAG: hypothetical protein A3G77_02305 [Acidobacteria bacterium RIFCSPLOWO2_12_FULL_68_19]